MVDTFKDVLPSILETKERVITEDNEKDYLPFLVNKAISYHRDCIFWVNAMNMNSHLPRKLQYDCFLYKLRKWKRPRMKWVKPDPVEDLEAVKTYYNFSTAKAKEAIKVLSEEELNTIKKLTDKGGIKNEKY
jgi:hypothetical protein